MGKTLIVKSIEQDFERTCQWDFFEKMIKYYLSLRNIKEYELAEKLGVCSTTLVRRSWKISPRELETIISILDIEDLDANRMRAKYWSALCGQSVYNCDFKKLYTNDAESTIRELRFENQRLKKMIDFTKTSREIVDSIYPLEQEIKKP